MEAIRVAVQRGDVVESRHRVHAVAIRDGETVAEAGDPGLVTFFRSSAKPLQALPLVRARDDLDEAEIAIACSSHQGEPGQVAAVLSLLARARASETDLECGLEEGRPHESIFHNCSGKHAGMLALCRARGWLPTGYRLPAHPVQREALAEVAGAAGVEVGEVPLAVDGCGVVTFALPLERMAMAFARFPGLDGAGRVVTAMRERPELVGGEGVIDTMLMQALPGWLAKRGGEGLLFATDCQGLALALKVEDGNARALRPALAVFLERLGLELGEDFCRVLVESSRGDPVGEVVAE